MSHCTAVVCTLSSYPSTVTDVKIALVCHLITLVINGIVSPATHVTVWDSVSELLLGPASILTCTHLCDHTVAKLNILMQFLVPLIKTVVLLLQTLTAGYVHHICDQKYAVSMRTARCLAALVVLGKQLHCRSAMVCVQILIEVRDADHPIASRFIYSRHDVGTRVYLL